MVADTFAEAMRPICVPIPVLIKPGAPGADVAAAVLAVQPDIAVLHLSALIPDRELPIEQLAAAGVVVTILVDQHEEHRIRAFVRRGAEAALSTELGLRCLVNVIGRVAAREMEVEPVIERALRGPSPTSVLLSSDGKVVPTIQQAVARLSVREGEILRQLMGGLAPAQIARHGYVCESTVRSQVRSILAKLGVGSQLAAVAIAYRAGWQPAALVAVPRARAG